MKISERILKTVRVGYLYANGKLVLRHEEPHKEAGSVEWVTIHDATALSRSFRGRILLGNRGMVRQILNARHIKAGEPAIENGSENTKRLGLPYGYVSLTVGPDQYHDTVHFGVFPGLVSSDVEPQPNAQWTDPEHGFWGGYRVAEHVSRD